MWKKKDKEKTCDNELELEVSLKHIYAIACEYA